MILLDDRSTITQRLAAPSFLVFLGLAFLYAYYKSNIQRIALLVPVSISFFGLLAILFERKHYFDGANRTIILTLEFVHFRVSGKHYPLEAFTEILITNEDREKSGYRIKISSPKRDFKLKSRSSRREATHRALELQNLLGLEIKDISRIPPWD